MVGSPPRRVREQSRIPFLSFFLRFVSEEMNSEYVIEYPFYPCIPFFLCFLVSLFACSKVLWLLITSRYSIIFLEIVKKAFYLKEIFMSYDF